MLKVFRWLLAGIRTPCLILLLAWGTLAIYYSNLPWGWPRLVLALFFFDIRCLGSLGLAYAAEDCGLCRTLSRGGGLV
jgi:hypothetical protein